VLHDDKHAMRWFSRAVSYLDAHIRHGYVPAHFFSTGIGADMRQLVSITFCVVLLLTGSAGAAEPSELSAKDAFKKAKGAFVTIQASDGKLGSGFLISSNYVVTNHHVIRGAKKVWVRRISDEKPVEVDAVMIETEENDLAILRIKDLPPDSIPLELAPADPPPEVGERVFVIGNPAGLEATITQGIVSGLRTQKGTLMLQVDAAAAPGSSGGPVMGGNGKVIGILSSGLIAADNMNFAVHVSALHSALSTLKATGAKPTRALESGDPADRPEAKGGAGVAGLADGRHQIQALTLFDEKTRANDVCGYDKKTSKWECDQEQLERFNVSAEAWVESSNLDLVPTVNASVDRDEGCVSKIELSFPATESDLVLHWESSGIVVGGSPEPVARQLKDGRTIRKPEPSVVLRNTTHSEVLVPVGRETCVVPPMSADTRNDTSAVLILVSVGNEKHQVRWVMNRAWTSISEKEAFSHVPEPKAPKFEAETKFIPGTTAGFCLGASVPCLLSAGTLAGIAALGASGRPESERSASLVASICTFGPLCTILGCVGGIPCSIGSAIGGGFGWNLMFSPSEPPPEAWEKDKLTDPRWSSYAKKRRSLGLEPVKAPEKPMAH
jgi:S1-C subfamily serine protease